ncbi:hypothetical protein FF2_002991 [Malus domestica]
MYVVHPNWLRPRSKGILINCEGFTQYIGSSSPLVDVASFLEVLFLPPGVVSLTGGDTQGLVKRYKPCSRSLPSRRARGSAERGDRQEYKAD